MTITYAYFRGNRLYNKGRLSRVHAFKDTHIDFADNDLYPICCTTIDRHGNDRISIYQKDIQIDNLCKLCRNYLIKEGERWFLKPSTDFSNNRGNSMEVMAKSETTKTTTYNLYEYELTIKTINGEFDSAYLKETKVQRTVVISSDMSLVRLFILLYRGLDGLGILSDEVAESLSQFAFDNK